MIDTWLCTACIHLPEKGHCTRKDCQGQPWWHFWESSSIPSSGRKHQRLTSGWRDGGRHSSSRNSNIPMQGDLGFFPNHPSDLLAFYLPSVKISRTPESSVGWREMLRGATSSVLQMCLNVSIAVKDPTTLDCQMQGPKLMPSLESLS